MAIPGCNGHWENEYVIRHVSCMNKDYGMKDRSSACHSVVLKAGGEGAIPD